MGTNLLRGAMLAALAPPAIAGARWGGGGGRLCDRHRCHLVPARRRDPSPPIGYRNADAAFFLICIWPLLTLATGAALALAVARAIVGAGPLLFELGFLAQSRGSVPAYCLRSCRLPCAMARVVCGRPSSRPRCSPGASAIPTLLEVYGYGHADARVVPLFGTPPGRLGSPRRSPCALAVVLWGVHPRLRLGPAEASRISRVCALVALPPSASAVPSSSPVTAARSASSTNAIKQFKPGWLPEPSRPGDSFWCERRIQQGMTSGGSRLRKGFHTHWWVVEGGRSRLSTSSTGAVRESPRTAQLEMLTFSELGFPGHVAVWAFVVAAVMAGWRSRRLGPTPQRLVAGALGSAHSGSSTAPSTGSGTTRESQRRRFSLLGAAGPRRCLILPCAAARVLASRHACFAAAALMVVPLYLSGATPNGHTAKR